MRFTIEPVTDERSAKAASLVRELVFEREWGVRVDSDDKDLDGGLTLLARNETGGEPVGVLSVVDTTANVALHQRLGLSFEEGARVARYRKLAVLKPYRGLNIPAQLLLEARRLFVQPGEVDYTWFLFDSVRANSSCFSTLFGFHVSTRRVRTEYGDCRVLTREEREPFASSRDQLVRQYLETLSYGAAAAKRRNHATGDYASGLCSPPVFKHVQTAPVSCIDCAPKPKRKFAVLRETGHADVMAFASQA